MPESERPAGAASDDAAPWRDFLALAHRLADASGGVIERYFRQTLDVEDKAVDPRFSPVTIADREAEAVIRALIVEAYPDHGILGEEHGHERPDARFTWVIDPIDGTKNFIAGMPMWGTLIALSDTGRTVVGVMNQPFTKERFVGCPDGSFLGERRLVTRRGLTLDAACLYCTEPEMYTDPADMAAFEALAARVGYRRYGGDCYAYAMLAMGFVDLVVEAGLNPWDIQALIPIVEGAGGAVTGWDGGPIDESGKVIAAGDPALHAEAVAMLRGAA